MANARRIHKISRVRTIGGRRKAFRNIFRKSRSLIGKGYRKVAGKKILKKMSAKERKKFNPKTNLKIRQALRKRKVKQRLISLKRKKTLRSGLYRGISKLNKNVKR
jgi:hypothetical protein|tara:strand:- start:303 stop:620 length:318 start_codon:yes stop_codon:yes gene_type:complete